MPLLIGDHCSFEWTTEIVWCYFVLLPPSFVNLFSLFFFWLIWKVKGNCCSTSNCTGDVMLSCQQGVDFKIPFSVNGTLRKLRLYFDRSMVYTLMVLLDLICISFLGLCSSCKECFDMFGFLFLTYYVLE